MGTVFSFDVRSPGCAPSALADVVAWLHWVDATFSTYRPDSEINRLDRGELTLAKCAPEVEWILSRCASLQDETDGYFSARAEGRLDPSGLVKGWAIETASDQLSATGSTNHCVNGGGDVQCVGTAGERPWRIGIADPRAAGALLTAVAGPDLAVAGAGLAVATSGTAERGTHIIDPHTSRRPDELLSVTLIGTRLATLDAYATAAFAMGHAAHGWLTNRPDLSAVVVSADGSVWTSPGLSLPR